MLSLVVVVVLAQADAVPAAQLRTARPLEFWVSPDGNDARSCRTLARACRKPDTVLRRLPYGVYHRVVVNVMGLADGGIGVYDAGVGYLQNHFFGAADPDNPGQVIIRCQQRPAVLDGGAASGTFSAVTNGAGATWASYTDGAQTWVPSAMVDGGTAPGGPVANNGFWLALVSGPGADGGMRLPISDNTASVLQVPGQFPVAPSTSTGYQVQEPAVVFTGAAGVVQNPGSETGVTIRATFPAQLIVRNNVSGYSPTITSGSPDGGSWSPVMVEACHFRADPAETLAALAIDGPVAVLESRFDGFGANGRLVLPISSRAEAVLSRNSIDTPGARLMTFTRMGTSFGGLTIEQNDVISAEYVVFGSFFDGAFLSHNNLFQRISTNAGGGAVYRVTETRDGYSFGDRVQHAPVFLRVPGGSLEQQGGRGQFWMEGISVGDISGPNGFVALSGRGGFFVGICNGNGHYGVAACSIHISAGSRMASVSGPGSAVMWRHSDTTITEDAPSVNSINLNDHTSGYTLAYVDTSTPHVVCGDQRGACAGWLDDANFPYSPIIGWVGSGGGGISLAAEPFTGTTSGGGVLTINFAPAFRDTPNCYASYEGDPGGGAAVPWAATTDGGVVWTAAASKALRGYCVGPR